MAKDWQLLSIDGEPGGHRVPALAVQVARLTHDCLMDVDALHRAGRSHARLPEGVRDEDHGPSIASG